MEANEGNARWLLGAAALAVLLLVAVGLTVLRSDGDDGAGSAGPTAAAADGTSTTATTVATSTTEAPVCTDASGKVVECLPVADQGQVTAATVREPLGWGGAQPSNMGATVELGSSSEQLTPERRAILSDVITQARATVERIGTVGNAKRLGYHQNNKEWLDGRGYEFVNWDFFQPELNLDQPGLLVAAGTSDDSPILSIAYNVTRPRGEGPPTEFPLEVIPWHYHYHLCWVGDEVISNIETRADGSLNPGGAQKCLAAGGEIKPEFDHWMLDLWIVAGWENPWGLVSSKHPDLFKEPQPWFPSAPSATPAATKGS